jgi:choline dehydrogenase-like flavoprotein
MERGGFLPREPQNRDAREVFGKGRYVSRDTWRDSRGRPFQPQAHYYVGGATKMYGAALFRLRPRDFEARQLTDGISPAWPLGYADFEPWYTAAEQMYSVRGHHGEDPTGGSWSGQYALPAVPHEPRIQQLSDDLERAGYHPFHAPAGVLTAKGCILCGTCDGFACQLGAKADAETVAVRPLLRMDNVTLMTSTRAERVRTALGTARFVDVVRTAEDGEEHRELHSADIIVLAAGAVNSAAILLRSGLANSSGEVGRNYMCHVSQAVMAITRELNPTTFQKTLCVNDFYNEGLGCIQMLGKSSAEAIRGESRLAALAPGWSLEKIAAHALDFWLSTEDLPRPENRVTLDADGTIRLSVTQASQGDALLLYAATKDMLRRAGEHGLFLRKAMPLAAVAHQAGTARFGTDPRTSVLDVNCQTWDVRNLYVADTSFMPSVGAVNPALTAMANALRVGEHIAGRLS